MARKKTAQTHHKKTSAESKKHDFPTMFFESISAETTHSQTSPRAQDSRARASGGRIERIIWMWSGVSIVMVVVFLTWAHSLNASGALNMRAWFQKDNLIQESRKSLYYYFEKQNQDRQEMNAFANSLAPSASSNTPILSADQVSQLSNKITALSASASSSTPVAFPSSLNKK